MKFGGTSVGSAARMRVAADLVGEAVAKDRVLVVASAVAGVTNLLVAAAGRAADGKEGNEAVARFRAVHDEILRELSDELAGFAPEAAQALEEIGWELENLLRGVGLLHECSPSVLAHLSGLGERASCALLAPLLRGRGHTVTVLDPRVVLPCAGDPLEASPLPALIRERFEGFREGGARLALMPGFFGGDAHGKTLCLGRGGSDYSASLAAAAVDAELLEIWTDVDGIYSADPGLAPEAFPLPELSFEEAMELSHFGARVLHPKTIGPVREKRIPVRVRNSLNPGGPGTLVKATAAPPPHAVRGLSFLSGIALLNVTGPGMRGVPGIAARVFGAIAGAEISVILITQASSECAITFCVREEDAEAAVTALHAAFDAEIAAGRVDAVEVQRGLSILSIVGDGMRTRMGVAGTFFWALAAVACNVVAIAQGSSERNISAVVLAEDAPRALRHAHRCFFDTREVLELYLFGVGTVGRRLLDHLARQREALQARRLDLRLCAVANSRRMLLAADGLDPRTALQALEASSRDVDLDALAAFVRERRPTQPVFLDCTSSEALALSIPRLMAAGLHVVAANKKGNSGSLAHWRAIRSAMSRHQRRFMYETNVGAGLPVIDTLKNLLAGGDRVLRFEGILSGSLSFIFGQLEDGVPFSEAVRAARDRGFTEPDPREDLSGQDVARKMLILHRELGGALELDAVQVDPVLPRGFDASGDVERLLDRLRELDAGFAERVGELRDGGEALRFVGRIDSAGCAAGLRAVASDHPLRGIREGENAFSFWTEHYQPTPLVVRGYGAGADVTAAGVLADVLKLVQRVSL